jgi:hypothetical protein
MAVNIKEIEEKLGGNQDFVQREILFRKSPRSAITVLFIETMCDKDYVSHYVLEPLAQLRRNIYDEQDIGRAISAADFDKVETTKDAMGQILSGNAVVVFEPLKAAVYVSAKKVKTRPIEKSYFEPSTFGSYESFNELIMDNISLIRKRVSAENLVVEKHCLGKKSNTAAALVYMDGVAPDELVKLVREKLQSIDADFVLNVESVAEILSPRQGLFDTVNYTELPEYVAASLFEGRVAVFINGCAYALTAPFFFFEILHSADDYASNHRFVALVRGMRFASLMIALLLPGIYVALSTHHFSLIPTAFAFKLAVSRSGVPFPTVIEVLLLFFFFELAREAGRRLPHQVGQALSIVGALILGDAAVGAGLASQATVVIIGTYAIASLINMRSTPWLTTWSALLVVFSAAFGLHGFYLGFFLIVANLASLRSCNYPFLFPFGTARYFKATHRDIFRRAPLSRISKPFIYKGK